MIGAVVLLIGILFVWIGVTGRGGAFWQSIFGSAFKPLGFGS